MTSRYFVKEPEIRWNKVLCSICNEPTGSKSQCYKLAPKDLDNFKKKVLHKTMGIVPIYAENCIFRKDNMWEATVNYPVSEDMLDKIGEVVGVERTFAVKTYTFQLGIGHLFDEVEVKKRVNIAFRAFIKELQVKELKLLEVEDTNRPSYIGVTFPNGQEFKFLESKNNDDIKQSNNITEIINHIENVSGIKPN